VVQGNGTFPHPELSCCKCGAFRPLTNRSACGRMTPLILPRGYDRIKIVHSFSELVNTPFADGVNAMCWQRSLAGDFREVVAQLAVNDGIVTLDESGLLSLTLSSAGRAAVDILIEDQRLLTEHGFAPILDCIHGYPREEEPGPVPIDVYDFHVDSATTEADTWLCTYFGPSSDLLRNDEAIRYVDTPVTRAELLRLYGGADDAEFAEYLNENCYDLHYVAAPNAQPVSFGIGNLWRIAVEYPGSPVPACIHRAPENVLGDLPRLLLIS
jgi:hypothetical protein